MPEKKSEYGVDYGYVGSNLFCYLYAPLFKKCLGAEMVFIGATVSFEFDIWTYPGEERAYHASREEMAHAVRVLDCEYPKLREESEMDASYAWMSLWEEFPKEKA